MWYKTFSVNKTSLCICREDPRMFGHAGRTYKNVIDRLYLTILEGPIHG